MSSHEPKALKKFEKFLDNITDIWGNEAQIRESFGKGLSPQEFQVFISLGVSLKANPFLREIFAVKFGSEPASFIVSRDLYRRRAQELEDYEGHFCEVVYPGEKYELIRNKEGHITNIKHEPNIEKRYADAAALPYGAYILVYKKSTKIPYYTFAPFREYNMTNAKKNSTGKREPNKFWREKPETMIKKVVESQGLRGAFQGTFKGTYTEDEYNTMTDDMAVQAEYDASEQTEALRERIISNDPPPDFSKSEPSGFASVITKDEMIEYLKEMAGKERGLFKLTGHLLSELQEMGVEELDAVYTKARAEEKEKRELKR